MSKNIPDFIKDSISQSQKVQKNLSNLNKNLSIPSHIIL